MVTVHVDVDGSMIVCPVESIVADTVWWCKVVVNSGRTLVHMLSCGNYCSQCVGVSVEVCRHK